MRCYRKHRTHGRKALVHLPTSYLTVTIHTITRACKTWLALVLCSPLTPFSSFSLHPKECQKLAKSAKSELRISELISVKLTRDLSMLRSG